MPANRGVFTIGPTTLRSGDIFGFHRCEALIARRDTIIVYPRVVSLPELGIHAVLPSNRQVPHRVRVLIDFLAERLR